MSIIQSDLLLGQEGSSKYQVSRSLRFSSGDSSFLSRTPASAGNRKTWTWSAWVKRSGFAAFNSLFGSYDGSTGSTYFSLIFTTSDTLRVEDISIIYRETTQVFRDPSAWYHVVLAVDTTAATASNRIRLYVNGTEVTAFNTSNNPSSSADLGVNGTYAHGIGRPGAQAAYYLNGYLANVEFVDGSQLTPSSFAETDSTTGQWIPKQFSGSYGSQGWKLTFADNSAATATTLGKDTSGNGNNWTPNNLSVTAGAGNDSLVDTPTSVSATDTGIGGEIRGNYCTLNPLTAASGFTLSNGNLEISSTSASVPVVLGTIAVNSGKWYWEVTLGSSDAYAGAATITSRTAVAYLGAAAGQFLYNTAGPASSWVNGSSYNYSTASTCSAGDVIGVALNFDANTITFYRNGVSQGTFSSNVLGTDTWAPAFKSNSAGASETFNFGQRAWAYTPPANHWPLVDTLLPSPVIANPNTVFDTVLWTGNDTGQTITLPGAFSPDLVWTKTRNVANNHWLFDVIRGANQGLSSSYTSNELTRTDSVTAFGSTGFTLGTSLDVNGSAYTYVAWCWDAGSSTVTNTQGSITSQVRANASAGFSIVTWSSDNTKTGTVGHGLGVKPRLVIAKTRNISDNWVVYTDLIDGSYDSLFLNTTAAKYDSGGTNFTSTVFNPYDTANTSGYTGVAYCFAPVAGYSSFGSYTGNGSTDGPFVFTGMRTRFLLIKNTSDGTSYWIIQDTARSTINASTNVLFPNVSNAEDTNSLYSVDILSNGFKLRGGNNNSHNYSGHTYIYAAFAESPFQYARAR